MTSIRDIYTIAMSIADSLDANGKAVTNENDEYQKRTPSIINILQSELASKGKLFNIIEEPYSKANEWIEVELPDNLDEITMILLQDTNGNYTKAVQYTIENKVLKVKSEKIGVLKIEYRPNPELLSSISDDVEVSDAIARSVLPYGLVAHLFLEENPTLASFCQDKYEENKKASTSRLAPNTIEEIIDVYGVNYGNY